jgi:hypothetical protein
MLEGDVLNELTSRSMIAINHTPAGQKRTSSHSAAVGFRVASGRTNPIKKSGSGTLTFFVVIVELGFFLLLLLLLMLYFERE